MHRASPTGLAAPYISLSLPPIYNIELTFQYVCGEKTNFADSVY
jgi:hypothetical protein